MKRTFPDEGRRLDVQYDVIFEGQVASGQDVEVVKKKLAAVFKLDEQAVSRLFSGRPVFVKRDVDFEAASKYWEVFDKVGAVCRMEPVKTEDEDASDDEEAGSRKIWY